MGEGLGEWSAQHWCTEATQKEKKTFIMHLNVEFMQN